MEHFLGQISDYKISLNIFKKIVCSSNVHNSQNIERAQMSINRWIDKEVVCIYHGILFSHQKEWNLAICKGVDGTRKYYAKWNKSEKEKIIWFHSCGI